MYKYYHIIFPGVYKVGPEPIVISGVMGPLQMTEDKWVTVFFVHPTSYRSYKSIYSW